MDAANPYQSPQTASAAHTKPAATAYRDRDLLAVRFPGARLPSGCAICGAPEHGRRTYKLRRLPVWLLGLIALFQPAARVDLGLCAEHWRRASRAPLIALLLVLMGVGIAILAELLDVKAGTPADTAFGLAVIGCVLGGVLYWIFRRQPLRAVRADRRFLWLSGVHENVLAQLPSAE